MQFSKAQSKKLVILSSALALSLISVVAFKSEAAIIVHDPKVFGRVMEMINKATEQVALLRKQVDLEMKNAKAFTEEELMPYKKDLEKTWADFNNLKKQTHALLQTPDDVKKLIDDTFTDFTKLDLNTTTTGQIASTIENNRGIMNRVQGEIITLVQAKEKAMADSRKRIEDLKAKALKAEGTKQLEQISVALAAEEVEQQKIANEIAALNAKQQAMRDIQETKEKEAKSQANKVEANNLAKASEATAPKFTKVKTQSEAYFKELDKLSPNSFFKF